MYKQFFLIKTGLNATVNIDFLSGNIKMTGVVRFNDAFLQFLAALIFSFQLNWA